MAKENKQAEQENAEKEPKPEVFEIAVLPLQNTTLFPETVVPLAVGRDRSMQAVEAALATEEKLIACITTKTENVTGDDAKYRGPLPGRHYRKHQADDAERGHHAAHRPGPRPF